MKKYDIAAYIWPSYTGDELRTRQFWEEGYGEWQTVKKHESVIEGDLWPRKPLWGYVNEANADVMSMEIDVAVKHGVNVFIYDWYWYDRRPFLEQCLNDGFLKAPNRDKMKFYLMWANHDATLLWDRRISELRWKPEATIWLGSQDFSEFKIIVDRLISKYFVQDNYYKIDGCPVFMLYDLHNFIKGFGNVADTRKALDYFRNEVVKRGFKGLHLQTRICDFDDIPLITDSANIIEEFKKLMDDLGFDSFTHYQMVDVEGSKMEKAPPTPYKDRLPVMKKENYKQIYFPHVSVGWDSNPRYTKIAKNILTDCTPDQIEKACRIAKEYADTHNLPAPLITINSWNEWTETSYIQPDSVYGYGYLEAIKKVFIEEDK